jgi:dTDP-4-dehydrorhamnose reductase
MPSHVLIIGASGSIGQNLIEQLVKENGPHTVIAGTSHNYLYIYFSPIINCIIIIALHRTPLPDHLASSVICEFGFNIRDNESIRKLFERHADKIDSVWNLAAPLSVDTAKDPTSAHDITVSI